MPRCTSVLAEKPTRFGGLAA